MIQRNKTPVVLSDMYLKITAVIVWNLKIELPKMEVDEWMKPTAYPTPNSTGKSMLFPSFSIIYIKNSLL